MVVGLDSSGSREGGKPMTPCPGGSRLDEGGEVKGRVGVLKGSREGLSLVRAPFLGSPNFIPKPLLWGWLLVSETKPAAHWEQ